MTRQFTDEPAARNAVPLLVGLTGPSGGGKTFSALRLATGMKRVVGGEIFVIDTEARRSTHYAEEFSFRHVPFAPPFSPSDYLACIQHCVSQGAAVIVLDSASHEWEGPGGILEMHEAECERRMKAWNQSRAKVQMGAWAVKDGHTRLVNTMLQMECHFVLCFRAKRKLKIQSGRDPVELGWVPITEKTFIYEFMVSALLLPGAEGVPEWEPKEPGERQMVKIPGWAKPIFPRGKAIDETCGQKLAEWAEGVKRRPVEEIIAGLDSDPEKGLMAELSKEARAAWRFLTKEQRDALTEAMARQNSRVMARPKTSWEEE